MFGRGPRLATYSAEFGDRTSGTIDSSGVIQASILLQRKHIRVAVRQWFRFGMGRFQETVPARAQHMTFERSDSGSSLTPPDAGRDTPPSCRSFFGFVTNEF